MGALACVLRQDAGVKRVAGELDEGIRHPAVGLATVALTYAPGQWLELRPHRSTALCVPRPTKENQPRLATLDAQPPPLHLLPPPPHPTPRGRPVASQDAEITET